MPDTRGRRVPEPMEPWQMVLDAVKRVESRMDKLVTVDTHQSDIRRLDQAQADAQRRIDDRLADIVGDLGIIRAERVERETALTASIVELRALIEAESEARRKGDEGDLSTIRAEIARETAQRKRDRQWLVGSLIALLGVLVGAVALFLR